MTAEGLLDLLLDPAHWGQEIVAEVLLFGVEILILDRLLHRKHPIIRPRHGRREDHRSHRRRGKWGS